MLLFKTNKKICKKLVIAIKITKLAVVSCITKSAKKLKIFSDVSISPHKNNVQKF